MGTLIMEFKPEEGLTKSDKLALMLLGGDCGSVLDGVNWRDGITQEEADVITAGIDWAYDEFGVGYAQFNENGTVEINGGNMGGADPYDNRHNREEWEQVKKDLGYE